MSITTQVAAAVGTAKLPGKVKAKIAAKRGGAAPKAGSVEAAAANSVPTPATAAP